jgi:hypothetical protein
MDAPLEKVTNIKLSGKYPVELYKEFLDTRRNKGRSAEKQLQ